MTIYLVNFAELLNWATEYCTFISELRKVAHLQNFNNFEIDFCFSQEIL